MYGEASGERELRRRGDTVDVPGGRGRRDGAVHGGGGAAVRDAVVRLRAGPADGRDAADGALRRLLRPADKTPLRVAAVQSAVGPDSSRDPPLPLPPLQKWERGATGAFRCRALSFRGSAATEESLCLFLATPGAHRPPARHWLSPPAPLRVTYPHPRPPLPPDARRTSLGRRGGDGGELSAVGP